MRIIDERDIRYCAEWLTICCMLHNFIMDYPDYEDFITEDGQAEENEFYEDVDESAPVLVGGEERRLMLFADLRRLDN